MDKMDFSRIPFYQSGADGFIAFVEENVRFAVPQANSPVPKWIYPCDLSADPDPGTGKSFKQMWENQKVVFREALEMRNGRFVHRLIVFCWPRGEGKSFMVCLIQLWKFFCFPRQQIVFGALSKDQTKFVHYEMIQNVLLNSPKLVNVIGKVNIQRGQTFLKNSKGEVISSFQPISTYSGIVSNITGYTFSEMFDMKDPKFFVQLDGSVRNIINALGTIDSTVSTKDHVLYRLYKGAKEENDRLTYFSYRSAPNATPDEYWHPLMDKAQLDSYKRKFPPADFDRYFKNVWELEGGKLFTESVVKSIYYFGFKDNNEIKIDDGTVKSICEDIQNYQVKIDNTDFRKNQSADQRKRTRKNKREVYEQKIIELHRKLIPMDDYYKLHTISMPKLATHTELKKLGRIYQTKWGILAGLDRSDPMARDPMARTILTVVAKGLMGSANPNYVPKPVDINEYIYLLLHLAWVEDATLESIKRELREAVNEYDGIDSLCSERWGTWDLAPWCEENEIKFEPVFPTYMLQKKAFSELYLILQDGRFKSPHIIVPGSQSENILSEELSMFDYHPPTKWYGSPQKGDNKGVQDDSIYALGWTIYGGRELGVDDFKDRGGNSFFGNFIPDERRLTYGL